MSNDVLLIAFYAAWAVATVVVFGAVFLRARDKRIDFPDERSLHEYYVATALFMASLSTLFGIGLAIVQAGTLFRLGFSALALGAFLGAGIVMLLEYPKRKGGKRG